ncbi:response regulator [Desulfomonile tiedjei]|uniref:Response regulator with CheY-like receiver, AAA-type ATPase, and DNA-binding domains n=1 Tax=Desulfomonile tiedjei (strain ATCC 49306 / DSM 6799 / DCB-1) TaxID=706587 RepID=I4CBQ8_DESTA|nr:response regulator [Desulfomonile tiedjei]AFM26999.1 response regulator with CheY-like receiver, AAA-type ATPase, and DNA-binding domains [Desulfomonile tiedjei DSM 6799]
MKNKSYLAGKHILAVDDEPDVLESIQDVLEDSVIDCAGDYRSASEKLKNNRYDLVILDIMGVDGLKLLEESVARNFPTVMLTAHAIDPDTLLACVRKGAISYLPKETLPELDQLLTALFKAHEQGEPPWKLLFDKLGDFFDERFGPGWKDKEKAFWSEFDRTYQIGKGIQERIKHDDRISSKGI